MKRCFKAHKKINLEAVLQDTQKKRDMKHLITVEEWRALVRATSKHVDEDEIEVFIGECEDMFIVPAIGVTLYEALVAYEAKDVVAWDEDFAFSFVDGTFKLSTEDVGLLLDGGYYDGQCGRMRCKGLKTALAYFVYAKVARNDGAIINRGGYMQHTDEYAQRLDDKQKVNRYNDIMGIAESYLSGCLLYVKSKMDKCIGKVRGKRTTIKAIGD